jgi:hypothetical protein
VQIKEHKKNAEIKEQEQDVQIKEHKKNAEIKEQEQENV